MVREEIVKEVESLMEGKDNLPKHARQSYTAFLQVINGLDIDQHCPYCDELLETEIIETAAIVKCKCGRSNCSFRGL
ncbi:hypothetical protein BCT23_24435 [Enterovibrio norvegicus]|uniref:Uncharacterized protein n=1 Tax=Enterovibrio norvegicus TaxID=188144 RepID=A0A2N7L3Q4_9GAMM|nr:hypothetical protein BCT69_24225 [Enterovibrio norvegicus]PMN87914.1 hypothetical protein BCT23_24435 [Enterovibrio norvegicus]